MAGIGEAALALMMIAALLLLIFGVRLVVTKADRKRGLLMIVAGIVFIVNVLIWTVGGSPSA